MIDFKLKGRTSNEYSFRLAQVKAPEKPHYSPYFSILWAENADGRVHVDTISYPLAQENAIFFLSPFQPYFFALHHIEKLITIEFNADFFCLEHHSADVGCNGILFNNAIDLPFLRLNKTDLQQLFPIIETIQGELKMPNLAQRDILLAYLKIFLVQATRIHKAQNSDTARNNTLERTIMTNLNALIEENYTQNWQVADYAKALNMATSTLATTLRKLHQKSVSQMIQDRLLIQAKRELVYSGEKPVKEIAYDLGFNDASYFIRFFKKHTTITPDEFRKIQFSMYNY